MVGLRSMIGSLGFLRSADITFSLDVALRSSLERIVIVSGPEFGDRQWRLATLPFAFWGLGTMLLRHTDIVFPGSISDDALSVFNTSMETDLLSNPSEIEDHTFDWLRTVLISGLGQTMNGKTYRCVLCYRLGIPLFSVSKPCSACSMVFAGDIYGYHAVSCAGILGIKHHHNVVRDTLVDICYRSGISAGKKVDIGFDRGRDKPLHPVDMLLYSWDGGLDVYITFSLDVALRSSLERIVIVSGPEFGDWQWRLATLPFAFWGLDVYSAGIPLFSVSKPCSACSRVFAGDIYGYHAVSCAGILGIKHHHNVVRDTLVDICYRSRISAGKKVDIGFDRKHDKPLHPADMLLYSWDEGLDVCVDLTRSSPLTQTGMVDFVAGRVVIDAAQRKRDNYMAKCAAIGYGFLPFLSLL
nr:hypothetical protein [Tanacetum cinerariifolium]